MISPDNTTVQITLEVHDKALIQSFRNKTTLSNYIGSLVEKDFVANKEIAPIELSMLFKGRSAWAKKNQDRIKKQISDGKFKLEN